MNYEEALKIATLYHKGQYRKNSGLPYITHPIAVADRFEDETRKIVAVMHDTLEDTDVSDLPIERIREEILKILMYSGGLAALENTGLLGKVIPEFTPCCLMPGGNHHNEYVNDHMANAQNIACGLTDNPILVFACAFHDIGKGYSYNIKEGGGISFHQHEKSGSIIIHDIMSRLKFSSADIKYTETIIAEHMVGYDDEMSDRAFIRRFSNLENDGVTVEDYMIMRYCDYQGNTKNPRVKFGITSIPAGYMYGITI